MTTLAVAISFVPGMVFAEIRPARLASNSVSLHQATSAIKVIVDGEEVKFGEAVPKAINGTTMVPFRPLFESLGANVEYDLVHKIVTATKDTTGIELTIGDKIAKKNGAEIMMAQAPVLLKGSTYVPLRFVAEALEAKVEYDYKTQVITIETDSNSVMDCGDKATIRTNK